MIMYPLALMSFIDVVIISSSEYLPCILDLSNGYVLFLLLSEIVLLVTHRGLDLGINFISLAYKTRFHLILRPPA